MCNANRLCNCILYFAVSIIIYAFVLWTTIDINYELYKGRYNMTSGCLFSDTNYSCNKILCYDKQILGCISLGLIFWGILFLLYYWNIFDLCDNKQQFNL